MNIKERTIAEAITKINKTEDFKAEQVIDTLEDLRYFIKSESCDYSRVLYDHLHRNYDNIVHYGFSPDNLEALTSVADHFQKRELNEFESTLKIEMGVYVLFVSYSPYEFDYEVSTIGKNGKEVLCAQTVTWMDDDDDVLHKTIVPSEVNFYVSKYFLRDVEAYSSIKYVFPELEEAIGRLDNLNESQRVKRDSLIDELARLKASYEGWLKKNRRWLTGLPF